MDQGSNFTYMKVQFASHFRVKFASNEVLDVWVIVFFREANYDALYHNFPTKIESIKTLF